MKINAIFYYTILHVARTGVKNCSNKAMQHNEQHASTWTGLNSLLFSLKSDREITETSTDMNTHCNSYFFSDKVTACISYTFVTMNLAVTQLNVCDNFAELHIIIFRTGAWRSRWIYFSYTFVIKIKCPFFSSSPLRSRLPALLFYYYSCSQWIISFIWAHCMNTEVERTWISLRIWSAQFFANGISHL